MPRLFQSPEGIQVNYSFSVDKRHVFWVSSKTISVKANEFSCSLIIRDFRINEYGRAFVIKIVVYENQARSQEVAHLRNYPVWRRTKISLKLFRTEPMFLLFLLSQPRTYLLCNS